MNEDWKTLGLEGPTDDLQVVKRAYGARLRLHRPDTDPEGFQRLREAYERVLEVLRPRTGSATLDTPLAGDAAKGTRSREASTRPQDPAPASQPVPGEPGQRSRVAPGPDDAVVRGLSATWKSLWQDTDRRRRKDSWEELLDGDAWHDLHLRRRLELEILADIQEAWLERDLRWIHEEAWLLLDRHFGWLDRELSLASVFLDDFVDFLAEEIRRSGRRFDPARFPPPPPPRFQEIEEEAEHAPKRSRTFWIVVSLILAILGSSLFKAGMRTWRRMDAKAAEEKAIFQELSAPAPAAVPGAVVAEEPVTPAVPQPPVVEIREWSDETGGLLPNTCAGGKIPEEPCPWTDRVQVLRAGRESSLKLVLTVGETPLETLEVALEPAQRLRLCTRKDLDVVALEEGSDPCSSRVAKAWTVRDLHLRPVGTSGVVCDTSQACRWRRMGL